MDSAAAAGIERNDDCNGARQDGAGLLQTTTKGGRRFSAADAFLRPAKGRDELELRPESRGSVRLRSADPADHPRITNHSLTSEGEVAAFLRAIELIREIASRPPLSELLVEELNPGASLHGADDLTAWLRATAEHEYHPSCTCRIGSPETGVVDAELRVHGVEGLRVADASVMPRVTSGNTHAPTVMIGERCADLVIGEPNSSE